MININGEDWEVLLVSPDSPSLIRNDGSQTIGMCDDHLKIIYISDNLSNELTKKVLCHELTHAAMFSYNINLTHEQEELLANLISIYGQEIVHMTNLLFKRIKGR